ncbi:hypothetical protein [Pedobacter punctiformis]|uniref:Lipoprotein n=1 Tax=Pedobacter punctiformis TaxID=3004097 RepID=A0ABT4LCL4_9SPHI|nr:hypothetical protein [Pedobacter sp. HCMS5-2]MCZ4245633.1 hypothetical protein [Pedobacter sp. HCMS5-2]
MKKVILSVAAIGLLATTLVSCDSTKKTETTTDSTVSANGDTTVKVVTKTTETTRTEAPSFSSEEVNKSLADFNKLKDDYVAALKSKNATEIQALTEKYKVWSQKATTFAAKLKPEEIQKYTDYVSKVSQEWSEAAQEAIK